ncbi:MAG: glutamate--tRNA ligase [Candidatus Vogelbacteria bacterium]|nr:glutamate--tRNA ligase [Candidatus Vogelbacteria bacterium]
MAKVVTRFPPSPTGYFHIGRARTALFNYLYARQNGGEMIFRLEDTDPERSKKKYEDDIIEGLKWLGIEWDNEAIPRQSERTEIYKKYLEKLVSEGKAYVDEKVVRLKNPSKVVTFNDLIRGEISFDTTELEDFIIARNISDPLYHLTVVVDDLEMGITHVIRGDDGIANTPRQILLQEAIAAPRPIYAHVPLILAADRSKLSSRHGAVSLREYREQGYLPEAMLNYLALLGWHPTDNQEVFSLDELMAKFDLERVQKAGAVFDVEKLNWFNREYLKKLPTDILLAEVKKYLPQKQGSGVTFSRHPNPRKNH